MRQCQHPRMGGQDAPGSGVQVLARREAAGLRFAEDVGHQVAAAQGPVATADTRQRLQHRHPQAGLSQRQRRRKTGHAGAEHRDMRRDPCRRGPGPAQRGRARQGGEGAASLSIKWRSGGHNECVTVRQALRTFTLLAVLGLQLTGPHAGQRMDAIRARGHLVCGVAPEDPGFSRQRADGQFEGFESDLCRAIGTALLGSSEPVRFVPLETVHQFLVDPQIDLVFHRLTWTLTREAPGQLEFGPVVLYEAAADGALDPLRPCALRRPAIQPRGPLDGVCADRGRTARPESCQRAGPGRTPGLAARAHRRGAGPGARLACAMAGVSFCDFPCSAAP